MKPLTNKEEEVMKILWSMFITMELLWVLRKFKLHMKQLWGG